MTVYPDEQECKAIVAEKKEWYKTNSTATVETTCIIAPAKVMENDVKPKRKETI
jgi:hypothetical protein